jgi:alkanesulfonate monooxygenase SsuD/methylene tetrahydromethanopterin reductase-like flavin-dependent oxidoreductase (luciferase family)
MTLRAGIAISNLDAGAVDFVREAERLGADSVWVPEYWAADALTPVAYLAACTSTIRLATGIIQLGARTPANLAMSAMSVQALSGGRFVLGIGTSGPQVMEGSYGVRFDRPIQRTRETIEIIRAVSSGQRLEYQGEVHILPLPGGEGRSIRSLLPPAHIPIYVASLGPANLRLTGELADRWIGNSFLPGVGRGVPRRERLRLYHEAGITTLRAIFTSRDQAAALTSRLPDLERLLAHIREVNAELADGAATTLTPGAGATPDISLSRRKNSFLN